MSDASEGPGWWQASDGKWYPPESRAAAAAPPPPQYAAAPPPAKQSRGCLIGALAGVGGFVVLGVIALVVVIVIVVAANSSSDNKNGSNPTVPVGQGTQENPAVKDVTVTECKVGEPPVNFPEARGEITNHSSKPSNYLFTVSFERNGQRVAQGTAAQNNIQPGQTAAWTATGAPQTTAGTIECKLPEVTRLAS